MLDCLNASGVDECGYGGNEIDAMLPLVDEAFALVPFKIHFEAKALPGVLRLFDGRPPEAIGSGCIN